MRRQRVLVGIRVVNGRDPVPQSVESAPGLRVGHRDVDVVVMDETRPDPVRAAALQGTCESLALGYYRSPRGLGAPRAMNLVLLKALAEGYDHVLTVGAEAVLPLNTIDALVTVAETNPGVGSVTAWSNELPDYAIPNRDGSGLLRRQDMVDWISFEMARSFGPAAIDLPASGGPCILFPVSAIRQVGLFDPVYSSGNLECIDWTLRSRAVGLRAVLAPSAFVAGPGDDQAAGGPGSDAPQVVADQRRVIDLRHPSYRDDLQDFADSGAMPSLVAHGLRTVIVTAAARWGYDVETTTLDGVDTGERVVVRVAPYGERTTVRAHFCGFRLAMDAAGGDVVSALVNLFGRMPNTVEILDRGPNADRLLAEWDGAVPFRDRHMYPQGV